MNRKIKVGIIGTGNIGCDLLVKIQKSPILECSIFAGRNFNSKGMQFANSLGVEISDKSIDIFIERPDICDIVFDATTASAHVKHAEVFKKIGKYVIDLTPSLIGKMCVPTVNALECLDCDNVNMVTCGGQATIPIVNAIAKVQKNIKYIEIVASIASKSAGAGTRSNIDEFTQTTKAALAKFSNVNNTKAIIILNPAEPPIMMHNTIYFAVDNPDMDKVIEAVKIAEKEVQKFVNGYKILMLPAYQNGNIIIMVGVEGSGDYLPKYSGNLDIITCSAVEIAERYARRMLLNV